MDHKQRGEQERQKLIHLIEQEAPALAPWIQVHSPEDKSLAGQGSEEHASDHLMGACVAGLVDPGLDWAKILSTVTVIEPKLGNEEDLMRQAMREEKQKRKATRPAWRR